MLARGALKGAAILLDDQPGSRTINWFETAYADETRRAGLEEKAAEYIVTSGRLKGEFRMEEGESWFCSTQK